MLCPLCKEDIKDGAMKCKHCGSMISGGESLATLSKPSEISIEKIPQEIRDDLKNYPNHQNVSCLECGYSGIMGIVKSIPPWWASWPTILIFILCFAIIAPLRWGIALSPVLILTRIFGWSNKIYVSCPKCKKVLGPI
jgi:hypothetical protein